MKQNMQRISFYGKQIMTTEVNGEQYVAMKPVCENIGINWDSQRKRITRHAFLESTAVIMTVVAEDGKDRDMLMLPVKYIQGWLFTVDSNRVKPEIKDRLINYQKECFDVLHKYWTQKAVVPATGYASTTAECHSDLHVFLEVTRGRMKISSKGNPYNMVSMATAMVLQALYNRVDEDGGIGVSARELAKELKICNRTVCRAIDRLERWLFLDKLSEPGYRYELRLKQMVVESALDESRASLALNRQSVGYLPVGCDGIYVISGRN